MRITNTISLEILWEFFSLTWKRKTKWQENILISFCHGGLMDLQLSFPFYFPFFPLGISDCWIFSFISTPFPVFNIIVQPSAVILKIKLSTDSYIDCGQPLIWFSLMVKMNSRVTCLSNKKRRLDIWGRGGVWHRGESMCRCRRTGWYRSKQSVCRGT